MARTVDTIKALIYAEIETKTALRKLFEESPSQVALWKEIIHTVSVDMAVHEQIMDEHLSAVDAENSRVFNAEWLKEKILEFQYDAATPEVLTLSDTLQPEYAVVDEDKRIISHAVVRFDATRVVNVLVAKNDPPEALTVGELAALQSYLTDGGSSTDLAVGIGFTGVAQPAASLDPDYVWFEAEIKYQGEFADTIQDAVKVAIVNYYHELEQDGYLRTITLVDRIQAVEGVTDVIIENLAIRANTESFTGPDDKHYLVNASTTALKEYISASGYAYEEVTAGETLTDKLTFTAG